MYPFTVVAETSKKSKGTNLARYLVLHHTGGNTFDGNVARLSGDIIKGDKNPVSVQFVIGKNEETAKIGNPKDILRHCGESQRGKDVKAGSLNAYAMGIEVVGSGEYDIHQFIRLTDLVEYLMYHFGIPRENVIRHIDITQLDDKRLLNKTLRAK